MTEPTKDVSKSKEEEKVYKAEVSISRIQFGVMSIICLGIGAAMGYIGRDHDQKRMDTYVKTQLKDLTQPVQCHCDCRNSKPVVIEGLRVIPK